MFNLEYLGAGSDSIVYKKYNQRRVIKYYSVNQTPEKLTPEKIHLYHELQNKEADILFELDIENMEHFFILTQFVKTITFEILHLDTDYIGSASSLTRKLDGGLVISEVDFVPGETLAEIGIGLFGSDEVRGLTKILTQRIASIYQNTQLGNILSHYYSKEIFINATNFKCKLSGDNLHLITTDTMNCIGLLKV